MKNEQPKPESYILWVDIRLNTKNIIKWCFPDLKTDDEVEKFIESLYNDKTLNLDRKAGLCGKYTIYSYDIFYDAISGLNPIYRTPYGRTMERALFNNDDIKESQSLFANFGIHEKLIEKFPNNHIGYPLVITPSGIGFDEPSDGYPKGYPMLSQTKWIRGCIPYNELIKFYRKMEPIDERRKSSWNKGNVMVKEFPKHFQDIFEKEGIEYNQLELSLHHSLKEDSIPVLSYPFHHPLNQKTDDGREFNALIYTTTFDNEGKFQKFETPYYEVTLSFKFYVPPDSSD